MNSFFAHIKKDIQLFFSRKTSIAVLLLPVCLVICLSIGMGESLTSNTLIKPFALAVRDKQNDVFSKTIISAAETTDIISEVIVVNDDTPIEEFFSKGCAAVIDLPENVLDSIYSGHNDLPITFYPNPEMRREADLTKALVDSAIETLLAEQKAWRAEYLTTHQRLNKSEVGESFSMEIAKRAINRSYYFTSNENFSSYIDDKMMIVYFSATAMLCLLAPLAVIKTIPEEQKLGIIRRYRSAKKNQFHIFASKYLASIIVFLIPWLPITLFLDVSISFSGILSIFLVFTIAFLLYLLIAISTNDASKMQLVGNIFIIVSMLFGGCFYSYSLLPNWGQIIAKLSLPNYLFRGLMNDNQTFLILVPVTVIMFAILYLVIKKRRTAL